MVCLRSDYSKPFFILLTPPLTNSFTVSLAKYLPSNAVLMGSVISTLVHPIGFEPMTYALEVRCSIQLSYGCIIEGYPYDEHPSVPFNQLRPDLRLGFYFLLPLWYSERESNPHGHYWPLDFKSNVSTYSTTRAS